MGKKAGDRARGRWGRIGGRVSKGGGETGGRAKAKEAGRDGVRVGVEG